MENAQRSSAGLLGRAGAAWAASVAEGSDVVEEVSDFGALGWDPLQLVLVPEIQRWSGIRRHRIMVRVPLVGVNGGEMEEMGGGIGAVGR